MDTVRRPDPLASALETSVMIEPPEGCVREYRTNVSPEMVSEGLERFIKIVMGIEDNEYVLPPLRVRVG
jgi:hypothetical protein